MSDSLVSTYGLQSLLAQHGDRLTIGTLRSYVSRGTLPEPAETIRGTRFWRASTIYEEISEQERGQEEAPPAPSPFRPESASFLEPLEGMTEREQADWLLRNGREEVLHLDVLRQIAENKEEGAEAVVRMEADVQEARRGIRALAGQLAMNRTMRATQATLERLRPYRQALTKQIDALEGDMEDARRWLISMLDWTDARVREEMRRESSRSYQNERENLQEDLHRVQDQLISVNEWALQNPGRLALAHMPKGFTATTEDVQEYLQEHPGGLNGNHLAGADFDYRWDGPALRGEVPWRLSWIQSTRELYLVSQPKDRQGAAVLRAAVLPSGTTLTQMMRWLGPLEGACQERNSIAVLLKEIALQEKCGWPSLEARE